VLTSSIRISVATPEHPETPSTSVFPDLLRPEHARGKVLVDPTRFVADPARAVRFLELPYLTLRLAYLACEYFDADLGLASVRAEHRGFYRRVFVNSLSPPRDYPGLTKPIGLMAIDFPGTREKVFARYPYLRSSYAELRALFERAIPLSRHLRACLSSRTRALRSPPDPDPAGLHGAVEGFFEGHETANPAPGEQLFIFRHSRRFHGRATFTTH
jgi:hypothetical protein